MICTERDKFVANYIESLPSWVVWLNSGLVVFQDDGRPGVAPLSAWERLYDYCQTHNDYIVKMNIRFRSNVHTLPSDAEGYYFSKGVRGSFGMPITHQLFFVGALQNDRLKVTCWKVPEMLEEKTETRNPNEAGICLIRKGTNLSLGLRD